jgi:hypothetical protein
MTIILMRHLRSFRGPKTRVRCFLHVINLIAALIIRRLEDKDPGDAGDAPSDDDNLRAEPDELASLTDEDEQDEAEAEAEAEAAVEPVRTVINKVSAQP